MKRKRALMEERLELRVPAPTRKALDDMALADGWSLSDLVRHVLKNYVDARQGKQQRKPKGGRHG